MGALAKTVFNRTEFNMGFHMKILSSCLKINRHPETMAYLWSGWNGVKVWMLYFFNQQ